MLGHLWDPWAASQWGRRAAVVGDRSGIWNGRAFVRDGTVGVVRSLVGVVGGMCFCAVSATAQTPRTAWGDPDLQGLWTNSTRTPLERPSRFVGRERLTAEEIAELEASVAGQNDRPPPAGDPGTYNEFWWDRGNFSDRPSLVVDPADGRIPALTPEGETRAAWARGTDSWVDRTMAERCVTRGAPKRPGGYNNNIRVFQTPTHVAMLHEMIHEPRIFPLGDQPRIVSGIRLHLGDSRAYWDGDTLVVETRNFRDDIFTNSFNCCPGAGGGMRLIERFTRIDADTIEHRYTVDDLATYERQWTVALPMTRIEGPIYEYACHEGNYGMEGILTGARAEEGGAGSR